MKNKQQALEELNKKYSKTLNLEDSKETKLEKQKVSWENWEDWEDWVDPIIMSFIAISFLLLLAFLFVRIVS
tara:strand:+ start:323 stop:538 length:216 start_codon:yes stop_codon:yes gene_type:complete